MFIDQYESGWINWLDQTVTTIKPAERLILLIDGAFRPGIHRVIRDKLNSDHSVCLLFEAIKSCSDDARDVSPLLFEYVPNHLGLQKLLVQCDGMPMVSALITSESCEMLAARLAAWCIVESDDQSFNFRFPDTRRLPGIFRALTPEQQQQLAGPCSQWSYIARNGSWQALPVVSTQTPAATNTKLTALQFAEIIDDCRADEILFILASRGQQWPYRHSQLHAITEHAMTLARKTQLDETLIIEWCENCLGDASAAASIPTEQDCLQWAQQHAPELPIA